MLARVLVCFLCCLAVITPIEGQSARAQESRFDPLDILDDGIDFGTNIGFTVLTTIRNTAKTGINILKTSRRGLKNIIKNSSGALKRQAKRNLRQANNLKNKIVRQRNKFKRLSKRILRLAASGADVPASLGKRAGTVAGKILISYQQAIEIESSTQQLQAAAAGN